MTEKSTLTFEEKHPRIYDYICTTGGCAGLGAFAGAINTWLHMVSGQIHNASQALGYFTRPIERGALIGLTLGTALAAGHGLEKLHNLAKQKGVYDWYFKPRKYERAIARRIAKPITEKDEAKLKEQYGETLRSEKGILPASLLTGFMSLGAEGAAHNPYNWLGKTLGTLTVAGLVLNTRTRIQRARIANALKDIGTEF